MSFSVSVVRDADTVDSEDSLADPRHYSRANRVAQTAQNQTTGEHSNPLEVERLVGSLDPTITETKKQENKMQTRSISNITHGSASEDKVDDSRTAQYETLRYNDELARRQLGLLREENSLLKKEMNSLLDFINQSYPQVRKETIEKTHDETTNIGIGRSSLSKSGCI